MRITLTSEPSRVMLLYAVREFYTNQVVGSIFKMRRGGSGPWIVQETSTGATLGVVWPPEIYAKLDTHRPGDVIGNFPTARKLAEDYFKNRPEPQPAVPCVDTWSGDGT